MSSISDEQDNGYNCHNQSPQLSRTKMCPDHRLIPQEFNDEPVGPHEEQEPGKTPAAPGTLTVDAKDQEKEAPGDYCGIELGWMAGKRIEEGELHSPGEAGGNACAAAVDQTTEPAQCVADEQGG